MDLTPTMDCPRCGNSFIAPFVPREGGKIYCKNCTNLIIRLNRLETKLIEQDFSVEHEDARLAEQIHYILSRETPSEKDEELLTALTERMLEDVKRRKKILKEILVLQKKKR